MYLAGPAIKERVVSYKIHAVEPQSLREVVASTIFNLGALLWCRKTVEELVELILSTPKQLTLEVMIVGTLEETVAIRWILSEHLHQSVKHIPPRAEGDCPYDRYIIERS